jgi:hypothetical protein
LYANDFIDKNSLSKIRSLNFYNISRCGIYHTMTIKSGLLIDSIHMNEIKVFYYSPINNGILVSPWNFLIALEKYFENYIENLKINSSSEELRKFNITFNSLFQY